MHLKPLISHNTQFHFLLSAEGEVPVLRYKPVDEQEWHPAAFSRGHRDDEGSLYARFCAKHTVTLGQEHHDLHFFVIIPINHAHQILFKKIATWILFIDDQVKLIREDGIEISCHTTARNV